MTDFPARGQRAPEFWDTQLKAYIDEADAAGINRANHTGQQPSTTISDFQEAVSDALATVLAAGSGVTLTYDDSGNSLTVTSTGGGGGGSLDEEAVRDAIGVAMVGVGAITVTVNDPADTITISTTATVNSTDAALRARSSHTGTQSADTVTDGTTNKAYTATEKTKLAGVATNATQNSSDAALLDRANHTGLDSLASKSPGSVFVVKKDPTTGFWPASWSGDTPVYTGGANNAGVRPTARGDIMVIWKGPDPTIPVVTSGTGGQRDMTGGAIGDLRVVTPT